MKKLVSVLLILALAASCVATLADGEWEDYTCEEDGFTTKKPVGTITVYNRTRGYEGSWIYLQKPVSPPYAVIHRRPADKKIKDPNEYLNHIYLDFLKEKYAGSSASFSPATTMRVGGRDMIGIRYRIGDTVQLHLIETREAGDAEFIAVFAPVDDQMIMEALDVIVANYAEDDTPVDDGYEDDFSYDDLKKEDWYEEHVAWWAEKRKEAKEFTDHFSEKLTEQDLLAFDLTYSTETPYVLGETTLRDLMNNGWFLFQEEDGGFSLYDRYEDANGILLYTENGTVDEPIVTMDATRGYYADVTYCGFDGLVGVHTDDPDENWYPDDTGLKLDELLCETGERGDLWDGLVNWLVTDFGAVQNEDGIYQTKVSLSDGRTLYISSKDSQVRISLVGFE